jgi:uncharacterized membrane protein
MSAAPDRPAEPMAPVLDRNIKALLRRREQGEASKTRAERFADSMTRFAGTMKFVYIHFAAYATWILINLPWSPDWLRFDKSLVVLAMAASVEAIFLSTFILITQNRMQAIAEKRADLDLQISLLTEHELTRLITLVKAVAERLHVSESRDPELEELEKDVHPESVLDRIEPAETIAASKSS